MKYYSILLIPAFLSSTLFAASLNKRDAIQELVQKLEAFDPNIKSHQDDWLKVRNHLEQAAQQSESATGLKLSVQHILDQWGGLRFRVLDRDDAQYWAMNGESLALPNAWFSLKGARWQVQYSLHPKLRRGDSFSAKSFSPFSEESQAQKSWTLPVQQKLMTEPKSLTLELNRMPMSQWALDLTQQSSKVALVDNKRVCIEKVWFWLDKVVAKNIASKIENAPGLCQALLIDLRDSFGEGLNSWPKLSKKMPVAVLTNQGTREGAVVLLKSLKNDSAARVFGERTDSDRSAQSKEKLSKIDWTVLIVGDGGSIIPDQDIRDSALNAEGIDDITEAGLSWIRTELTR